MIYQCFILHFNFILFMLHSFLILFFVDWWWCSEWWGNNGDAGCRYSTTNTYAKRFFFRGSETVWFSICPGKLESHIRNSSLLQCVKTVGNNKVTGMWHNIILAAEKQQENFLDKGSQKCVKLKTPQIITDTGGNKWKRKVTIIVQYPLTQNC